MRNATRERDGGADRREVEHAEGLAGSLLAIQGDNQIWRRADERRQAAEERAEGERHQRHGRRIALAVGVPERDRQHQRERADIVHEAGKHRDRDRLRGDLQGDAAAQGRDQLHHDVDDAGILQARLITSTAATVSTAGWTKPRKASAGAVRPVKVTASSASRATTS
jgi:hypothetical protein